MSLLNRYADAYLIARTVNGTGQSIKVVGFVAAGITVLAGLLAARDLGASAGFAGFFLGALMALPFYALGVLISAQGQILMATLDTAVNSSPLLSAEEVRHILTGFPLQLSVQPQSMPGQVPQTQAVGTAISSDASPSLVAQPATRSCPHCQGLIELNVTRCRWCMKKV
jgi:hypothetical protein